VRAQRAMEELDAREGGPAEVVSNPGGGPLPPHLADVRQPEAVQIATELVIEFTRQALNIAEPPLEGVPYQNRPFDSQSNSANFFLEGDNTLRNRPGSDRDSGSSSYLPDLTDNADDFGVSDNSSDAASWGDRSIGPWDSGAPVGGNESPHGPSLAGNGGLPPGGASGGALPPGGTTLPGGGPIGGAGNPPASGGIVPSPPGSLPGGFGPLGGGPRPRYGGGPSGSLPRVPNVPTGTGDRVALPGTGARYEGAGAPPIGRSPISGPTGTPPNPGQLGPAGGQPPLRGTTAADLNTHGTGTYPPGFGGAPVDTGGGRRRRSNLTEDPDTWRSQKPRTRGVLGGVTQSEPVADPGRGILGAQRRPAASTSTGPVSRRTTPQGERERSMWRENREMSTEIPAGEIVGRDGQRITFRRAPRGNA